MQIDVIQDQEGLEQLSQDWDRLAEPLLFQQSAWARAWWQAFGDKSRQLMILKASNDQGIVGILPTYAETTMKWGRTLQFVGSGKACGDYLDLIAIPEQIEPVSLALADFLTGGDLPYRWDTLCLEGVKSSFPNVELLAHLLAERGCGFDRRPIESAWRLTLPGSWDEYLGGLSKRTRRTLRTLDREYIQTGRAELDVVKDKDRVLDQFSLLIEMHELRREQLGSSGCFSVSGFQSFVQDLATLYNYHPLELRILRLDDKPIAANFGVVIDGCFYIYQCGFYPEYSDCKPGWILNSLVIQESFEGAFDSIDFLRGDERYKQSLGAKATELQRMEIAAPTSAAMLRRSIRITGSTIKQWWSEEETPEVKS